MKSRIWMICVVLFGVVVSMSSFVQSSVMLYGDFDVVLFYMSCLLDLVIGGNVGCQFVLIDMGMMLINFGIMGIEDFGGGLYV